MAVVKIKNLITKRTGCLLAVTVISGSMAAWWWLVFVSGVEEGDFKAASVLPRILICSGALFAALLLLGPLYKWPRRFFRWLFDWRIIKRGLIGLAGLFVIVALFYVEENWRGRHAWEEFKRDWEARGERLDFASFVPPTVPDDQNFALTPIVASCYHHVLDRQGHRIKPEHTNVVNRLDMTIYREGIPVTANMQLGLWPQSRFTDLSAWQHYYRTMSLTNDVMVEPAVGERFARQLEVRARATNEFPTAAQAQSPGADVLLALGKYDSALDELRQASRLPFSRFPLEYAANNPGEMVFPHYEPLKATAAVLRLRAIAELHSEQPAGALADVQLMLRLADAIRHEPVRWSLRTRLEIVNFAIQPVWEGLARRQWSDDQLVAIERELAGLDAVRDYTLSLRSELAWRLKSMDYMRAERMENSFTCMCGDTLFWPTLAYRLTPDGWFYLNQVAVARCVQAAFPTSTELSEKVLSPDIARRFEETTVQVRGQSLRPGNLFVGFFLPALEREANTCARTQSSVDLARVACALERFRRANGGFPESLNSLVPACLSETPRDVVNGQPLRYRATKDGSFVLYSVGWNDEDDGGEPETSRYLHFGAAKPAGDWVWRYPAH